jgi:Bacterial regulatory proteins, tetR family
MGIDLENGFPADGRSDGAKRRQIVEGARQVFLAQGFDAASMGSIARAAGVSKGTLYVCLKRLSRNSAKLKRRRFSRWMAQSRSAANCNAWERD